MGLNLEYPVQGQEHCYAQQETHNVERVVVLKDSGQPELNLVFLVVRCFEVKWTVLAFP